MFSDDAVLRWKNDESIFSVEKSFIVKWRGREFIVPKGFRTDLASIPRWATPLIPKLGHHLQPAVAHDWLCKNSEGFTDQQINVFFYDAMLEQRVGRIKAWLMHKAVKVGRKR